MSGRFPNFLKTTTIGLCSLLLLAACGGGSNGSSSGNTAQAPPPAPPPPPPPVNQSPVAVFSLSTADGFAPLTVTFDSSASQDSDGQITSHLWDFGDGSPTTTGSQVNHVFQAPGSYNVRLTVTDDDGASGTTVNSIRARGAELSGTIRILGSSAVDSDVNDRFTVAQSNNSFTQAQPIPNPVRLGGYVNLPGTGEPTGNLFTSGDDADFYAISLSGNEIILLSIGEADADLEMRLWDANQTLVDETMGSQKSLTVDTAGDYFVEVFPLSGLTNPAGASNYVLSVGQDLTITQRVPSRISDAFVPGEILLTSHLASARGQIHSNYGLIEHGRAGHIARTRLSERTPSLVDRHLRSANNDLPRHGHMTALQKLKHQTLIAIKQLQRDPAVASAEANLLVHPTLEPDDDLYSLQWHLREIQLPGAWDLTTGNPTGANDVIVAVIDTGILANHPDLAPQLVPGYDFIADAGRARDGDGIDPDPEDPGDLAYGGSSSFHGTHVAGTVAARTNNAEGVAGVSWGAKLMPLRALGLNGGTTFDVMQAILFAAGLANDSGTLPTQRADIINMSLGSSFFSLSEQTTIDAARAAGVIVIASAGNESSSAPNYPAAYNGVISVAASTINSGIAPYSNFGNSIDVAAPGGFNGTDLNGDGIGDGVLSTLGDDSSPGGMVLGYGTLNGTSMAAPHVAGVAALMKAVHPGLTPAEFDSALIAGDLTDDLGALGYDQFYGHGLINAQKAVLAALGLAGGAGSDPGPILTSSLSVVNLGVVVASQSITLTNVGTGSIVITDPPTSSEPWLSIGAVNIDPDGLGEYLLSVDRSGLTEGAYNATARFVPVDAGTNAVTVSITMQVPGSNPDADAGLHYVIIVDSAGNTVGTVDVVAAANGEYNFLLSDVPAGSYRLVGGSDMDDDSFLCDAGEACGAYRTLDVPEFIEVDPTIMPNMPGLDFVSEFRAVISAAMLAEPASDSASNPTPTSGLRITKPYESPR